MTRTDSLWSDELKDQLDSFITLNFKKAVNPRLAESISVNEFVRRFSGVESYCIWKKLNTDDGCAERVRQLRKVLLPSYGFKITKNDGEHKFLNAMWIKGNEPRKQRDHQSRYDRESKEPASKKRKLRKVGSDDEETQKLLDEELEFVDISIDDQLTQPNNVNERRSEAEPIDVIIPCSGTVKKSFKIEFYLSSQPSKTSTLDLTYDNKEKAMLKCLELMKMEHKFMEYFYDVNGDRYRCKSNFFGETCGHIHSNEDLIRYDEKMDFMFKLVEKAYDAISKCIQHHSSSVFVRVFTVIEA
jgi:hypothetical protein